MTLPQCSLSLSVVFCYIYAAARVMLWWLTFPWLQLIISFLTKTLVSLSCGWCALAGRVEPQKALLRSRPQLDSAFKEALIWPNLIWNRGSQISGSWGAVSFASVSRVHWRADRDSSSDTLSRDGHQRAWHPVCLGWTVSCCHRISAGGPQSWGFKTSSVPCLCHEYERLIWWHKYI